MASFAEVSTAPVVVWMEKGKNYVESVPNILLRIKHPSHFGEDIRGIPNFSGHLVDVNWDLIMSLRPAVIELTHSKNPLYSLTAALRSVQESKLDEFFGRMKILSLDRTDIAVDNLIFLLQKLKLLEGFSFSELDFSRKDWELVLPEFQRLNIRAMDISQDILDLLLDKMNVELLKLSTFPGLKVDDLKICSATFVTVSTLVIQELDYTSDSDAEELIKCIESKFPRLKALIWDWSIVDPAVAVDERSRRIVESMAKLFKRLNLQCFATVLYTPCNDTKYASGELARLFSEAGLPIVQLHRFASKGLSKGHDNFTVITAGEDCGARAKVHSIYVEGRTSAPNLRQLVQLIDDFSPSLASVRVVEFGGFDAEGIRKAFAAARQDV